MLVKSDVEKSLPKGPLIAAVSGGIDSVVMLDIVSDCGNIIVVHFDHGIRVDSSKDAKFVEGLAHKYGLTFETERQELGPNASEAEARIYRHAFLQKQKDKHRATKILTAHHMDDVVETMIINISRGTGRKGLTSLKDTDDYHRPLLSFWRSDIEKYAKKNKLRWREDPTNKDKSLLRNYIRHELLTSPAKDLIKNGLKQAYQELLPINDEIDVLVNGLRQWVCENEGDKETILRSRFVILPVPIQYEILRQILDSKGGSFSRAEIHRLAVFIKTGKPGARHSFAKRANIVATKTGVIIARSATTSRTALD